MGAAIWDLTKPWIARHDTKHYSNYDSRMGPCTVYIDAYLHSVATDVVCTLCCDQRGQRKHVFCYGARVPAASSLTAHPCAPKSFVEGE